MLSAMGWEKFQITPGIFSSSLVHGGDQLVLVLMKTRPPLLPWASDPTKYSVLKKPVVSVPSSGRPTWLVHWVTSGKEHSRSRAWFASADALRRPGAGRQRAAHPQSAFIQMRQELRADHAAQRKIQRHGQGRQRHARP